MKRKCALIILLSMLFLTACGAAKSEYAREKSEAEIVSDLENSDLFWFQFSPESGDDYTLDDFEIIIRETMPEESDFLVAQVAAHSEYATYTGNFEIKYVYSGADGTYVLNNVSATSFIYSDIKLPEDLFARDIWTDALAHDVTASIQDTHVEAIPGDEDSCKLVATYMQEDPLNHSHSEITAFYTANFKAGTWSTDLGHVETIDSTTTYDEANEIYWEYDQVSEGIRLVNAYMVDQQQYYDEFIYRSEADLNYKYMLEYGFISIKQQVPVSDQYIGHADGQTVIGVSEGSIDEDDALQYLAQIKNNNPDLLIILDPRQYLEDVLYIPGSMVITNEYINEEGLHVAEVAQKGTLGYQESMG